MVDPDHLVVGHVTKPHGIKGEVFVWPLTDSPDEVFAPDSELLVGDESGELSDPVERAVIERSRPYKRGLLVKFRGYEDRSAVERLAQHYLLVPAGRVEPPAEGEVHYHRLLGLDVVTTEGVVVGRVREVYETEPAHLLEVKGNGREHLIPFTERVVKEIDLETGRLVIDPPPGLLEL